MIPSRTFDKYFNWLFLEINQSSQQMLTDVDAMPARVNGIILLDREVGDLSAGHKTPWSPAGCQVWEGFPSNMKIQPTRDGGFKPTRLDIYIINYNNWDWSQATPYLSIFSYFEGMSHEHPIYQILV